MKMQKVKNHSSESRNNQQKRLSLNSQIVFLPHSRRSNMFVVPSSVKTEVFSPIKTEVSNSQLETESSKYRINPSSISSSKLSEINPLLHSYDLNESINAKGKFIIPNTCIKKIKEPNNSNQNESLSLVSHNDFRHSLNFQKKSNIDKHDKPSIVSKRKISENIVDSNHKEVVHQCFGPKTAGHSSRFVSNKNSKYQIIATSNSVADSDKENEEKNNVSNANNNNDINANNQFIFKLNSTYSMSHAGKNKEGLTKVNQDTYLVYENILGLSDYCIYGIMDGHGSNGHLVSQYIESEAKVYFSNEELYLNSKDKVNNNGISISGQLIRERLEMKDFKIINSFYKKVNRDLIDKKFDVHFSGSTCVLLFHIGNKLICANTGDSRGILIRDDDNCNSIGSQRYSVIPLSNDHKPESEEERKRIESSGGEVDQYETEGIKDGPFRVWVKGELYPGIAISRTIGDEIAESIGVIYNPEFITVDLTVNDKYVVIASDGVWEFLDNNTVMSIINPFYFKNDIESACKAVIDQASKEWEKEGEVIDDISVIIVCLRNEHFRC